MDDSDYIPGLEAETETPKRPGLPVEPRRLLRCVLDQRKWLLLLAAVGAVLGAIAIWLLPKDYESSARLVFEGVPALDASDKAVDPRAFIESAATSDQLRKLRDRLGWDVSLRQLREELTVTAHVEDGSMTVDGRAHDPNDARQMVQGLVELFLEQQTAFNVQRIAKSLEETTSALQSAREQRTQAEEAHSAFQKKSGKPNVVKEQEQLLVRVSKLREKADEQTVEVEARKAEIAELEKARANLPSQIVASAVAGSVVDRALSQARSELAAATASLSAQHPKVLALQQRVKGLEEQRKTSGADRGERTMAANPALAEVEKQLATARAALAGAQEKEAALRTLSEEIKAEAYALTPAEGEARKLLAKLELAQTRVDELSQRAARLQDASRSPASGFRVVAGASLPETADRSGVAIALLGMLPLFLSLLGALVIIGYELRHLDIQTPRELAWWGEGPVLGTSVWPRRVRALDDFVDEMEDHGIYGFGRTLVIPATETERDIACTLAMRLAEAPWLAAAILDVEEGVAGLGRHRRLAAPPDAGLTTPVPLSTRHLTSEASPSGSGAPKRTEPSDDATSNAVPWPRPRSSTSSTVFGMPAVNPKLGQPASESGEQVGKAPESTDVQEASGEAKQATTGKRGKRGRKGKNAPAAHKKGVKKTIVGLPAVNMPPTQEPQAQPSEEDEDVPIPLGRPVPVSPRLSRASVRMLINSKRSGAERAQQNGTEADDEEAFLLTRPAVLGDKSAEEHADVPVSKAVMRAAVRLLSDDDEPSRPIRHSTPPSHVEHGGEVTGVALAWNGPLSGPVLRRAARLAHRVMVVVSAGVKAPTLAGIKTRLGRSDGVGYVLVNLADEFVDLEDRVGPVETFWEGSK